MVWLYRAVHRNLPRTPLQDQGQGADDPGGPVHESVLILVSCTFFHDSAIPGPWGVVRWIAIPPEMVPPVASQNPSSRSQLVVPRNPMPETTPALESFIVLLAGLVGILLGLVLLLAGGRGR